MAVRIPNPQSDSVEEIWLPVVGWEGIYDVSNLGRIRSLDRAIHDLSKGGSPRTRPLRGRVLKGYLHTYGYPQLRLCRSQEQVPVYIHHLVAAAFIGPRPAGMEVAHDDGDPGNARLKNLRYATPVEKMADCRKRGTHGRGAQATAKLTPEKVREIRSIEDVSQSQLAKRYGVSQSQIWCVKNRVTWKHIE